MVLLLALSPFSWEPPQVVRGKRQTGKVFLTRHCCRHSLSLGMQSWLLPFGDPLYPPTTWEAHLCFLPHHIFQPQPLGGQRCLQFLLPRLCPGTGPKVTLPWLLLVDPTQESLPWQSLERQVILVESGGESQQPPPLTFPGPASDCPDQGPLKLNLKGSHPPLTTNHFLQNLSPRILLSRLCYILDIIVWVVATRHSKSWFSAFLWILASIMPQPKLAF